MVTYTVHGRSLEFISSGPYSSKEWDAALRAACHDQAVPENALLLIDIRDAQVEFTGPQLLERVRNLRQTLGPKMGSACALVLSLSAGNEALAHDFQLLADREIGLRVGLFSDMAQAKRWLAVY